MTKKTSVILYLLIIVFVSLGCTQLGDRVNEDQQLGEYRPMISVENQLYGDTGNVIESLSTNFTRVGEVEIQIAQTEPMKKAQTQILSNTLPVGTEIFVDDQNEEFLYANYNNKIHEYQRIDN
ncbi:hypothetical protein [Bacillus alkalicellulosilyticus]|uniref:hypothetical protein n=1 Tax=Alkalihalobacterium alkalicellulosilyticum TaxID=1912214 RepID=UPI000996A17F|nr:hypothetical protein [Bacillus alkalicellulosilyticus]